jgi:acid phosphatase
MSALLAGFCLLAAIGLTPALAENACHADFQKTCPADYAAKTCPTEPLAIGAPQPPNTVVLPDELDNVGDYHRTLTNYKCSGAYDHDIAVVLDQALTYVEQYPARAAGEKPLAIVFDIDETVLSNWPAILTDDYGFIRKGPCDLSVEGACGFEAWQLHAKDEAILPALKVFDAAKDKHIAIFFVTGRCDVGPMKQATAANLLAAGFQNWNDLILRSEESCKTKLDTVVKYKAPERAKIEAHYKIIANVGDQWSDLNGGSAEKNFKVPNPFYFIP